MGTTDPGPLPLETLRDSALKRIVELRRKVGPNSKHEDELNELVDLAQKMSDAYGMSHLEMSLDYLELMIAFD